uniref:YlxP-like protein n=1 Tax=uncultured bacterium esnapd12 TaxID=1366592 RepID=S5TL10_9BACT|nr:YlxP-like protein [uncultured bacterium esnapd12]
MWIGWLEFDLLLGDVHSLKQKRSVVRPLVAELQRRFSAAAAECAKVDLHRRAGIGLAVVAGDRRHVVEVLDAAERLVAARPEVELLSARRGLHRSDDE